MCGNQNDTEYCDIRSYTCAVFFVRSLITNTSRLLHVDRSPCVCVWFGWHEWFMNVHDIERKSKRNVFGHIVALLSHEVGNTFGIFMRTSLLCYNRATCDMVLSKMMLFRMVIFRDNFSHYNFRKSYS